MGLRQHCKVCNRLIDRRGLPRHMEMHNGQAKFLGGGTPKKEIPTPVIKEVATLGGITRAIERDFLAKLASEDLSLAYQMFPQDPFLFNALTFMIASKGGDGGEVENLKTAMIYLDLKIQSLGGWSDK